LHPQLLTIHIAGASWTIGTYGVLMLVGAVVGIRLGVARGRGFGVSSTDMLHIGLIGAAAGLGGAIGLYFAIHLRELIAEPSLFLAQPGVVFFGGLAGGGLGAYLYCRGFGIPFMNVADAGAPALALAHSFGRLGCLAGGCCYGRPTDLPWAVELAGAHRHPVQAYEAVGLLVLVVLLLALGNKRRPGTVFLVYAGGYALLRLLTESFRGDNQERVLFGPFATSQLLAGGLLLAVFAVVVLRRRRRV
jgi:phosphatidylglycerol:prolipoprotein diacylglycerol transferase